MPKVIVTDNAANLKSATINFLCKQWNVKHHFTTVYHPQSNMSERYNRNIKILIRSYVLNTAHNKWVKNLPMFQLALNTAVSESTGFTPAQLFLNREFTLPFDNAIQPSQEELNELFKNEENINDFIFNRRELYQKMLDLVKSNLKLAQSHQKEQYDGRHRDDKFKVGDLVLLRNIVKSSKKDGIVAGFAPPFDRGPAVISKVLSDLTYEVILDGQTLGPFHIQFLRRYNIRENSNVNENEDPNDEILDPHNLQLFSPGELPFSDDEDEIRSIPDPIINPNNNSSSPSRENSPSPSPTPKNRPYNLRTRTKVDYKALHTGKRK
jgi:hypothetical protein